MPVAASSLPRVSVDGKFFRLGEKKFYVRGVAYGPFAPNAAGQPFASPEQTAADFDQIRELNANLIRVYHVPSTWFLDLAAPPYLIPSASSGGFRLFQRLSAPAAAVQELSGPPPDAGRIQTSPAWGGRH